jgi:hypothetical protein
MQPLPDKIKSVKELRLLQEEALKAGDYDRLEKVTRLAHEQKIGNWKRK